MRVLLVEDSRSVRAYVEAILRRHRDIEVLPEVVDGARAVELARTLRPDVILMDLELPVLHGIDAIREIMATSPRPIVVLSAWLDSPGRDRTFEAFDAGAVEVLAKPRGLDAATVETFAERLVSTVRLMASARVVRRLNRRSLTPPSLAQDRPDVVVIGCSTGGPPVLDAILKQAPAPFRVPVVVCQHIVPGFEQGLADWLRRTGHDVRVVSADGETLVPGRVFVARADCDLAFVSTDRLEPRAPSGSGITPSVDVLFHSAARVFGARALPILLTGMGEDGAAGLEALRRAGARTIAQTAESCVVDGMPGAARARGAVVNDLSPVEIGATLTVLATAAVGA